MYANTEMRPFPQSSRITVENAYLIAQRDIRACYCDDKILAALTNYSDPWARDTFWALPGIISEGDTTVARNCLEYFLAHQKANGHIPRKFSLDYDILKYVFKIRRKRKEPRIIYHGLYPFFACVDSNALLIIAFDEYCKKSNDILFAKEQYGKLKKTIDWYEGHLHQGFVREHMLANWMDTVIKNGHVLSTNILYAEALHRFAHLAKLIGNTEDAREYKRKAITFVTGIHFYFWNGDFFSDQIGKDEHFDVAGNVLACYFGIATEKEKERIVDRLITLRKGNVFLPTVDPLYPFWKINPISRLFKMGDYHNGNSWLWIDALASVVMYRNGAEWEAHEYFHDICTVIARDGAIHETYRPDGRLYGKCFGVSITPFAWNSGVFLTAYHLFRAGNEKLTPAIAA